MTLARRLRSIVGDDGVVDRPERSRRLRVRRLHARARRARARRAAAHARRRWRRCCACSPGAGRLRAARRRHRPLRRHAAGRSAGHGVHEPPAAASSRSTSATAASVAQAGVVNQWVTNAVRRARPPLRARSLEPAGLHDRRQRRRELGRTAHAQVRRHDQPRARRRAGAAVGRGRPARRRGRGSAGLRPDRARGRGARGRFGIVTRATLRLSRDAGGVIARCSPSSRRSTRRARRSRAIIAAGIVPAALEMMDRLILAAVEAAFHVGLPTDAGRGAAGRDRRAGGRARRAGRARRRSVCRAHGAREVRRRRDEAERAALWKCRKRAFGAVGRLAPNYCTQDGVVPRTRVPDILRAIAAAAERHRLRIGNVFHAGDGNIHPIILFDERDRGRGRARARRRPRDPRGVRRARRQRDRRARHRRREDRADAAARSRPTTCAP